MKEVFRGIFRNCSDEAACISTILTTVALSIFDIFSDILVATSLFSMQRHKFGWIVLLVDYFLPGLTLILHNAFSKTWRGIAFSEDIFFTISVLLLSPFSSALFHIRWLVQFESADDEMFNYLHHNSRLSKLLNVSFESPVQIVILLILWGNGTFELPWSELKIITDSHGREVYLGSFPAAFSFIMSFLSILIGSLDISEERTWQEQLIVFVYALCNYLFRLSSFALLGLYFHEWSLCIIPLLIVVNLIIIIRYDPAKRENFSIITSVLIVPISPVIASDQANLYQKPNKEGNLESVNKYRRKLSAMISMATFLILFLSNIVLYLLLVYQEDFITPSMESTLVMDGECAEKILSMLLLPLGVFLTVSNLIYYRVILPRQRLSRDYYRVDLIGTQVFDGCEWMFRTCFQSTLALIVCLGVITLFCVVIYYDIRGSCGKLKNKLHVSESLPINNY